MSHEQHAGKIIDDLIANGAVFTYQPAGNSLPATFSYALPRGGDRWKCRGLILQAKSDPAFWRELVAEVGRRAAGGAE